MKETPGLRNGTLPFAELEVEEVNRILPQHIRRIPSSPSKNDLMKNLPSYTIFHFAGHGISDPKDPSKSRILLKDWEKNPLTVTDVVTLNLNEKSPWMAVLTACLTGENRDEDLYDESIHIVNACQMAGFQHVIGSLWEVSDMYSFHAASEIYETLKESIGESEDVAFALHRAVRFLRDGRHLPKLHDNTKNNAETDTSSEDVSAPSISNQHRIVSLQDHQKYRPVRKFGDPFIWAACFHVGL
jgi:CHAT domain-containing protein